MISYYSIVVQILVEIVYFDLVFFNLRKGTRLAFVQLVVVMPALGLIGPDQAPVDDIVTFEYLSAVILDIHDIFLS